MHSEEKPKSCEKDRIKSKVFSPDLTGKVVLLTGGTAGIGAELLVHLSHLPHPPARIIFTGRNSTSADAVIARCRSRAPASESEHESSPTTGSRSSRGPEINFIPMDLSSLSSVSTASNQILSLLQTPSTTSSNNNSSETGGSTTAGRLDILLANAGIMAHPPGLSPDGYEIQFATNHLGHALLIRKLLPLMRQTAATLPEESSDVRMIITSSAGWRLGKMANFPFDDLAGGNLFEGKTFFAKSLRYGNSKLANVVYARELAKRFGDDGSETFSGPGSSFVVAGTSDAGDAAAAAAAAAAGAAGGATGTPVEVNDSNDGANDDSNGIHLSEVTATATTNNNNNNNGNGNAQGSGSETAQRRKGILTLSLTPGVVGTGLVNDLPLADKALVYVSQLGKILTPEEGIRNHLWALSSPREEIVPGAFYEPVGKIWSNYWRDQVDKKDTQLGTKMWDWTEEQIGRWL